METAAGRRRAFIIGLGVCLVLLFLVLGTLNAFNLKFLNPASPAQTLVFIALSVLAFLLFVGVLLLLVRNVLKLYSDQRSRVLGTRLRTRMLLGAVLVSLVPLVFMALFSYLLMNRAADRWFSQPVTEMREDSNRMAQQLITYVGANAHAEADSIAVDLSQPPTPHADKSATDPAAAILRRHGITLQGGFAALYRDNLPIAAFQMPKAGTAPAQLKAMHPADNSTDENPQNAPAVETSPLPGPAQSSVLTAAQRNDGSIYSLNGTDYMLATAASGPNGVVVVGLPIPPGISATTVRLRNATDTYWTLFRERRQIRALYMVILLLITTLALFACCWLALNLSKQVTRPVELLADAMEAIAAGDYAQRVPQSATEELGELAASFNAMATDLEGARSLAEQSAADLSHANAALQARRSELETIIETIPNGVATLSSDQNILIANRAFSEMVDPGGQSHFAGAKLADIFSSDVIEALQRLLRRSHRMGAASAELDIPVHSGSLHISATVALLEGSARDPRQHLGYVLVLENLTDLLRAQKQSAWKEVARRVAHEIKNPLTPISLNAEQIGRHIGRLLPLLADAGIDTPSAGIIQRSSAVISSSVETMRSLVDQFATLAEFPSARPLPADLNTIVENSLALFAGRIENVRVVCKLAPALPLVLADPEALKRALSNLIDNAAEAMQKSLLREMHMSTRLLATAPGAPAMVELAVADTGPGLTDDMRERLFLPYFSTKQRGTGLGLAIAAKILQEHGGSLRAEKNQPAGARFIMELRAAVTDENNIAAPATHTRDAEGVSA